MEWRAEATLLAVRRHGETAAIIEVFTEAHGRHLGVVPGGAGRRLGPVLQPGAELDVTWRARLEGQLGQFAVEPVRQRAALVLGDRAALAGLAAVCALLSFTLPERAPHPGLWRASRALLDGLAEGGDWPVAYLRWELLLLEETGFGLDLSCCTVTGARSGLVHVSPRSGRAVSAAGAGAWAERLLPLPPCLRGHADEGAFVAGVPLAEVLDGLITTGHFLARRVAPALGDRPLPPARARLMQALERLAAGGPVSGGTPAGGPTTT